MLQNPKLLDWFTILSQDKASAERVKLKMNDKAKNKQNKVLQNEIESLKSDLAK